METKTRIVAGEGRQEIMITRDFAIPVHLLYQAYTVPELIQQWMGNKVVKWEKGNHGSYRFETKGPDGTVLFSANGTIHSCLEDQSMIRTFEMENADLPVQLEYLTFEALDDSSSRLTIQIVCKSTEARDKLISMPFAFGLNMAHNRLEEFFSH